MASILLSFFGVYLLLCIHSILGEEYDADEDCSNPIVKSKLGPIRGSTMETVLHKTIYAFRGIRYAKPPINELRFQPPEPVEAWNSIYDATDDRNVCPQPDVAGYSEDCLFLNVFTTKLGSPQEEDGDDNVKHPVIVYIHAGGFYSLSGASQFGGPEYLLDQNIVLVTFNYRLAALGFISTGDQLAPGNNGLKDQVLVLKWVKENIDAFGGDPDLVTLCGYSAGGDSVSLHLVSPMSKGLFHRAIIMSGSSYGHWQVPHEQFSLAQRQAGIVGCPNDTSSNIINCLKTIPAQKLGDSLLHFHEFRRQPILIWHPVIEQDFGQERFLTDTPAKLVECGDFEKVPVMAGITREEFSHYALDILLNSKKQREMNTHFENVAPIAIIHETNLETLKHIKAQLRNFYFGDALINSETKTGLKQLYADGVTGFTIHRTVNLLAAKSTKDVFYYFFDYHGSYSHVYLPGKQIPYGVVHQDDLIYLFHMPLTCPKFNNSSLEYKMVNKLTKLFANFAKTGVPTPESEESLDNVNWQPYTSSHQTYLDITKKLSMKVNLFKERYDVWDTLFPIPQC